MILSKKVLFQNIKMTNTGPFLWNGSSKIQIFTDIWYLFCWRLLRPTYATFLKTGWWNSNSLTSEIYRYLQTKSNLHISICQSHFKRNISMWNTLYVRSLGGRTMPDWLKNRYIPNGSDFTFTLEILYEYKNNELQHETL